MACSTLLCNSQGVCQRCRLGYLPLLIDIHHCHLDRWGFQCHHCHGWATNIFAATAREWSALTGGRRSHRRGGRRHVSASLSLAVTKNHVDVCSMLQGNGGLKAQMGVRAQ